MPIELDLKRSNRAQRAESKPKENAVVSNIEPPPYSALTHIKIEDVPFVINLCPTRHHAAEVPNNGGRRRKKVGLQPDGRVIKAAPRLCRNPACTLRDGLIDGMMDKTIEVKDNMLDIAEQLEAVNEEKIEAEVELETQKQYLRDSEGRHELLKVENKECEENLEREKQEEYDCKNRVTELEAERQRLARIVFENKLKQQGIELEGWDGDGLTLVPSRISSNEVNNDGMGGQTNQGGMGVPGDYDGEPREDFMDRSKHNPPHWCSMEPLNLPEHAKVRPRSSRGVLPQSAMMRPKTSPPSCFRDSGTWKAWQAQAHILPQPSISSNVDDASVRRFDRKDRIMKPKQPQFDARNNILASRERNKQLRQTLTDNVSTFSWRSSPHHTLGGRMNRDFSSGNFNQTQRPSTVPTSMFRNNGRGGGGSRGGGSRGGERRQDVLSVMTDGTAGRGFRSRAL